MVQKIQMIGVFQFLPMIFWPVPGQVDSSNILFWSFLCPRFLAQGPLCQTLARMPPRRISWLFFWDERGSLNPENPLKILWEKSVQRVQCVQRICGAVAVAGGATGRTGRRYRLQRFRGFRQLHRGKLQYKILFCLMYPDDSWCCMSNYVKCSPNGDGPACKVGMLDEWCSNLDDSS